MDYLVANFLNDFDPGCLFIAGFTEASRAASRLALACDHRIPAACAGYVAILVSESASRAATLDAARMLSRFVEFYGGIPSA